MPANRIDDSGPRTANLFSIRELSMWGKIEQTKVLDRAMISYGSGGTWRRSNLPREGKKEKLGCFCGIFIPEKRAEELRGSAERL